MNALFDTNILIDYLRGIAEAQEELRKHTEPAISVVTWMEVMAGVEPGDEAEVRDFLSEFHRVDLTADIAERAVSLRRERRLKLPDAIIYASAEVEGRMLVSRNTRDFPATDVRVRVPY